MKTKNLTTEEIINKIKDASEGIYDEKGLTRYSVRIDDDNAKETVTNGLKNIGLEMKHLTQLLKDGALFGYFMDDRALHIRLNNDFLLNMKIENQRGSITETKKKLLEKREIKPQQPAHTKARINYEHNSNFSYIRYAELFMGDVMVATTQNGTGDFSKITEQWERIVKAVNEYDENKRKADMHERLIAELKRAKECIQGMVSNDSKMKSDIKAMWQGEIERYENLLKQAEQK